MGFHHFLTLYKMEFKYFLTRRWLISCPCIEDVNLDHNLIGDGGARELLQGLVLRKEAGLPVIRLTVTVYIAQETFQKIIEYSTPSKKKKKKGKKVKKKHHSRETP